MFCDLTNRNTKLAKYSRVVSSVGLERLLDRQEVAGSNPVQPTNQKPFPAKRGMAFLLYSTGSLLQRVEKQKSPTAQAMRLKAFGLELPPKDRRMQ